jgi:hypothetical protein
MGVQESRVSGVWASVVVQGHNHVRAHLMGDPAAERAYASSSSRDDPCSIPELVLDVAPGEMLNVGARGGKGPLRAILDNEDCGAGKLMLPGIKKAREARLPRGRYNDDSFHPGTPLMDPPLDAHYIAHD